MLTLKALTKRYRTGDLALDHVDLDVPKGQVVGLIGPSGAGKSTMIRCINRLVEPTSGEVVLNGETISSLGSAGLRRARRRIGMIFQEYALVERLSVMENVLSGRLGYVGFWRSWFRRFPKADVEEALRLLERVGLEQFYDKRADDWSEEFGVPMQYSLYFSGGQAIHYSDFFAEEGYTGASRGCVNTRDLDATATMFDLVDEGTAVFVYQ